MSLNTTSSQPRTPVERAIYGIWDGFLSQKLFGIEDNFFAIGGTPEMAEEVAEELRLIFLLDLPTQQLFASPTIAGMAARVEQGRRAAKHRPNIIPTSRRDGPQPLSFGQQRLWFLDQLDPGSASYNNCTAITLDGALDSSLLERSLNEIVRRHEALRTLFIYENGQALQRIDAEACLHVPLIHLESLPPEERRAKVDRLTAVEAAEPFDLAQGPLLRAKVLRMEAERFILLLSVHHIVSDGWSMGVLINELSSIYTAYSQGRRPDLPALPVQYADFSAWQRERLQGDVLDEHLRYWRDKLRAIPPVLNLITDKPRPNEFSFCGASYRFELPQPLVTSLEALSAQQGGTLFMSLLAGFALLMHAFSGDKDFCIGAPIAGRSRTELENLIGLFINMLILRMDLNGEPTFLDFFQKVKETTLGAYAHQEIPFELLVEKLRPKRDQSRNPFFQVIFVLANFNLQPLKMDGFQTQFAEIDTGTAKFDLSLYATGQPGGSLACRLEYSTDLFERQTIERMCRVYRRLLEQAAANPEQPVRALLDACEDQKGRPGHNMPPLHLAEVSMPLGDREDFLL